MNNFDKIITKATEHLLEYTENPMIAKAVRDIQGAITSSGKIGSNPNAKALASELFDIPEGTADDPLHSAFEKIKNDPENPNLSDEEMKIFLSVADKLNPKKTEETSKEGTSQTIASASTTTKPAQTSSQPNAKQYNPLTQTA